MNCPWINKDYCCCYCWRKLLDIDHLDVVFATKVIMAACVMHNFCLMYDDFDESYFLPNCGEDDENDGADDGRGPRKETS